MRAQLKENEKQKKCLNGNNGNNEKIKLVKIKTEKGYELATLFHSRFVESTIFVVNKTN